MSLALDICARNLAKAKEVAGSERAAKRAEEFQEGWIALALAFVDLYRQTHRGTRFMTEDVRDAYTKAGKLTPPDDRAWGHVMRAAAARGFIRKAGFAPSVSSNNSPKVQWEAL